MSKQAASKFGSLALHIAITIAKLKCGDLEGGLLLLEKVQEAARNYAQQERDAAASWYRAQLKQIEKREKAEMQDADQIMRISRGERDAGEG